MTKLLPWSFQQSPSGLFLSQGPCFESQRHKEESGRISGLESELSPYFQSSHLSCKRCECSSLWWFQPPATSVGHWYVCYQSRPWTTCRKENPSPLRSIRIPSHSVCEHNKMIADICYSAWSSSLLNHRDNQTKSDLLCVSKYIQSTMRNKKQNKIKSY